MVVGYSEHGCQNIRTEVDVYNPVTIQPVASTFMLKSGCYGNVYQISGVLQQLITKCVVGCRVMCNSNEQYRVKRKLADFDACSLCPQAMYKLDGLLEGKPKVLRNTSYEFLTQQDGYFIIIKIITLNKPL